MGSVGVPVSAGRMLKLSGPSSFFSFSPTMAARVAVRSMLLTS